MKHRKKLLCFVICVALTLVPLLTYAASMELVIGTPETLPKAGESFTVTVSVRNNPGFKAGQATLVFDKNKLTCNSMKLGPVVSEMIGSTNANGKSGAIFAVASVDNASDDGILATYTFTAKNEIDSFGFSFVNTYFFAEDDPEIPFVVVDEALGASGESGQSGDDIGTPVTPGEGQETPVAPEKTFTDVNNHWAKEAIARAVAKNLFGGYPDGSFRPDNKVTRAEFVTVLWKMAGQPACSESTPFTDVKTTDWFAVPVAWAYSNGYVSGTSATTFGPSSDVTREQAMTILFKYNGGVSGLEAMFTSIYDQTFTDSSQISIWARPAMYWGVYNKLISGTSATTLSPKTPASRAQLAVILVIYCDEVIQ